MKMRHNVSQISTPENNDTTSINELQQIGNSSIPSRNLPHLY